MTDTELLRSSGVTMTASTAALLESYNEAVMKRNKSVNLTGFKQKDQSLIRNVYDSLTVYEEAFFPVKGRCLDMGTGGGFPGMVLAILRPDMHFLLMDSLDKRIRFLEETAEEMHISNIKAVHMRAEEGGRRRKLRETFDVVTARAVKALPVLLEWTVPYVKIGGIMAAMKGPSADEELKKSGKILALMGAALEKKKELVLPDGSRRCILYFRKEKATPKTYPRKTGVAERNPIIG